MPAESLGQAADYVSPVFAASAIRLVSRLKLADRVNSPVNVVISNVPGPRQPLYFAGARLDAYIPVSTISDGVGLNITVHRYADRMDFGLISDRDLIPDLWHLVDLHIDEIGRLFEATGAERAVPQPPPPMRKGGDGVEAVAPSSQAVKDRIAADRTHTRSPSIQPTPAATKKAVAKSSREEGRHENGGRQEAFRDVTLLLPWRLYVFGMDSTDGPRSSSTSIGAPPPWMRAMELRAIGERASMSFAAPLRRLLPHGDGHHVIVLPGFAADDRSTRPLRLLLRDLGYHSHGWRLGGNVGPTPKILSGLYALLERIHGDAAAPVSIIGWSLGGIYARELARATPDHVRQVITLGSPFQMVDHDSSSVQGSYDSLKNLHDPSVQRHVREAFLPMLETPATSIYSRTDGVVKWQASLIRRTEHSENIRVNGSHCGLGFNNSVAYAVADRLAQPAGEWRHFQAPPWLRTSFPPAQDLDLAKLPSAS